MKDILRRNNVNVGGEGEQILLFAHGFGCDQTAWIDILPAFLQRYKVVLFDFVGTGKSDIASYNRSRHNTLEGYAEELLEICHALKLKKIILVCHSVSCMIGALASIKEPSLFEKMIWVCPSPRYLNDTGYIGGLDQEDLDNLFEFMDEDYFNWAKTTARAIMGNPLNPELGEALSDNFCSLDPEIAKEFARVTFLSDNRKDLQNISVESLTLQCEEDMLAPLEIGIYINQHTKGNKLINLHATGHCPHMSAPVETIEAIRSFL